MSVRASYTFLFLKRGDSLISGLSGDMANREPHTLPLTQHYVHSNI